MVRDFRFVEYQYDVAAVNGTSRENAYYIIINFRGDLLFTSK